MSVIKWSKRDNKARRKYPNTELNKLVLRSLLANWSYEWVYKFYWASHFHKYGKWNSISFYRRSCLWTASGRSVFKLFKFSRHWSKSFASNGLINGMRKSSF